MISPLHTILGGLTLTAQLLSQLSSCLDLIFPKRLTLNDFGLNMPSSDMKFIKKLIRLNVNVVHLCLCQNLDPELLKPMEAMHNLSLFLNHFVKDGLLNQAYKLNRLHQLSLTITQEIQKQYGNNFTEELVDSDHEDYSFNENDDTTWESVVPSDMMIVHPLLAGQQTNQVPNSPSPPPNQYTMSSVASSFMSSWLRGITSPANSPTSPHK